jgi:hypothetical protein
VLSALLIVLAGGLVVGFALGYRLGKMAPQTSAAATVGPASAATPTPAAPDSSADIQADAVSSRLQATFEALAPGSGWAVCSLAAMIECHEIVPMPTEPRVPPSEYGLGWYGSRALTGIEVAPSRFVVVASLGEGTVAAWLHEMGPGDAFVATEALISVDPGSRGRFFFDLGSRGAGHYVVEVDFMAIASRAGLERSLVYTLPRTYVAGFVVGPA